MEKNSATIVAQTTSVKQSTKRSPQKPDGLIQKLAALLNPGMKKIEKGKAIASQPGISEGVLP